MRVGFWFPNMVDDAVALHVNGVLDSTRSATMNVHVMRYD